LGAEKNYEKACSSEVSCSNSEEGGRQWGRNAKSRHKKIRISHFPKTGGGLGGQAEELG